MVALKRLAKTCEKVRCWPVKTNAAFLAALLRDTDVAFENLDTGLIAKKFDELVPDEAPSPLALQAAALMVYDGWLGGKASDIRTTYLSSDLTRPAGLAGFRLNATRRPVVVSLSDGVATYDVEFVEPSISSMPWVDKVDEGFLVDDDGRTFIMRESRSDGTGHHGAHDGDILSPMPGKIIAVDVVTGQAVTKGQKLVTLEAMKMEHTLTAPFDGTVAELNAVAGGQVQVDALLVRIEEAQ